MDSRENLVVGITGGMGCGKSTAAALFAPHGFTCLDADRVVREELLVRPEVVTAIRERFGVSVLDDKGRVDRRRLASVVFSDDDALRWLENLLHPRLETAWRTLFTAGCGQKFMAEVPLLFEKQLNNWFDFTICVTTDSTLQLRRLEQRGIAPELARQRIAKQLPLARKCEMADFVIVNDGSLEFLREQVGLLANRLLHLQTA
ncbi:MAG TPA: dephospho-CoA kinase [Candidatus Didemnitutus sp.]|nr:dephospho-CoA kinase [Candidatus Didemnitutus sp.]